MVERLFLAVPRGCLRFVIVVFPDHTHLLFLLSVKGKSMCTKFWLPLVQALLCELKTDMDQSTSAVGRYLSCLFKF